MLIMLVTMKCTYPFIYPFIYLCMCFDACNVLKSGKKIKMQKQKTKKFGTSKLRSIVREQNSFSHW